MQFFKFLKYSFNHHIYTLMVQNDWKALELYKTQSAINGQTTSTGGLRNDQLWTFAQAQNSCWKAKPYFPIF